MGDTLKKIKNLDSLICDYMSFVEKILLLTDSSTGSGIHNEFRHIEKILNGTKATTKLDAVMSFIRAIHSAVGVS
ncbi:MAG: hypothetical protein ACRC0G_07295 [Fusobacteriaceae bacterium]